MKKKSNPVSNTNLQAHYMAWGKLASLLHSENVHIWTCTRRIN